MLGIFAANWLVDGIKNNQATIQLGTRRFAYTSQPDGSWNPPPGGKTSLIGTSGNFTLQPRFGGSISFDTENRVSEWRDVDDNTQTYFYDNDGRLATVTDSQSRTLTFNYLSANSTLIQSVSDGTGRSVTYTYTGNNLTGITDPEGHTTSFVYDIRNLLTEWRDPNNALMVINTYDAQDRVAQQLSQGEIDRLWKFAYSPRDHPRD
jgi:YD repeat-containing protein